MYLKDYLSRFCIVTTHMARAMKTYPNTLFRIIREGKLPTLTTAIKIEDFTEGKVTPRDLYNECLSLKDKQKESNNRRKKKNSEKSNK